MAAGKVVAGPWVRLACDRHLRDRKTAKARGFRFDVAKAERAIGYFRDVLRLDDGRPFVLAPWQAFVVGSLFGWVRVTGERRFRTAYVETGKGPLALDTPIPTPTGWTSMGQVRAGATVFDEHGVPCTVTDVSPVFYGRDCYRLSFSDGTSIVADAAHRWRTAALRTGGRPGPKAAAAPRKGGYATRTTAEIAATLEMPPTTSRYPQAAWNHRVDVNGALTLPAAALPIEPYAFGVWLGDGDSDCARITMGEQDAPALSAALVESGTALGGRQGPAEKAGRYRLRATNANLRHLGVLRAKHIPTMYLRASEEQRMALLQGLMDTDGSISADGRNCEISLCAERLALDTVELVRSLGYKATYTVAPACVGGRQVGQRWRIRFTPYADRPVFRLPRKVERLRDRSRTRPMSCGRMIVGCDPVPSVPVRCITVNSASHLFLAGEGMVPTHNSGKTPMAAGIGLLLLSADDEAAAEVYSAATAADQAKICWLDAKRMVERSPALSARVDVSVASLAHPASGSWFRAVSSEHKGLDGKRVHGALVDELHEHRDAMVVDKMRAGTKGRRQALIFEITNSGYDRNSVCWQHHEYSLKVVEGVLENDEWFAYVCALDEDDDWQDPAVWPKANPSLGVTITERYLAEQVREAQGMPSKQNIVKRLNFCIWTEQADRWLPLEAWDEVTDPVEEEALRGRICYGGLDLSSTTDLTALALLFPPEDEGERWKVLMRYWVPAMNLRQRVERDRVPYDVWVREGWLRTTPGNVVDYDYIESEVRVAAATFQLRELAYDRFFAGQLVTHLQAEGMTVTPVGQGFVSMAAPCRELEKLVMGRQLAHGGHPVLRWNVANAAAAQDPAGNIKPDKASSTERIDGVVAILDALARAMVQPSGSVSVGLL